MTRLLYKKRSKAGFAYAPSPRMRQATGREESGTPGLLIRITAQGVPVNLASEVRFALRNLSKAPVFSAVAVMSLALGIGANTAIFTLIDRLILRLLPVRNPTELVMLDSQSEEHTSELQ